MADVARAAGVHQTTVSRALRNDPRIRAEVRERIKAVAEDLGYRPNPLLSVLGTLRRQRAIAPYETPLAYIHKAAANHRLATSHLEGARRMATQLGFKLEVFTLDAGLNAKRLNDILVTRSIQGIIIGPLPEAHGCFALEWDKFCTVVIEYSFTDPVFDRVATDSYSTMNQVIVECRRRGFSRLGPVLAEVVDERNEGLLSAAYALSRERDAGLADIPALILPGWNGKDFMRWLKRHRPQVVISSNLLLPQIHKSLRDAKLRTPADIGLVNLNATPGASYSGICEKTESIGAQAIRLLVDKLNHNERGIPSARTTLLTQGYWLEGRTLRRSASKAERTALPV